jgi:hypothetical protein
MSGENRSAGRRHNLPPVGQLRLMGGAAVVSLALLVSGCGRGNGDHADKAGSAPAAKYAGPDSARYDAATETGLGLVIGPRMKMFARRIMNVAVRHPELFATTVTGRTVELAVAGTIRSAAPEGGRETDRARFELVTRRLNGSSQPDLNAVLAESVRRSSHVQGDSKRNFGQGFDLYAPGGSGLAGPGDSHTQGWSGREHLFVGKAPADDTLYATSGPDSKLVGSGPVETAKRVASDASHIMDYVGFDLAAAASHAPDGGRFMP